MENRIVRTNGLSNLFRNAQDCPFFKDLLDKGADPKEPDEDADSKERKGLIVQVLTLLATCLALFNESIDSLLKLSDNVGLTLSSRWITVLGLAVAFILCIRIIVHKTNKNSKVTYTYAQRYRHAAKIGWFLCLILWAQIGQQTFSPGMGGELNIVVVGFKGDEESSSKVEEIYKELEEEARHEGGQRISVKWVTIPHISGASRLEEACSAGRKQKGAHLVISGWVTDASLTAPSTFHPILEPIEPIEALEIIPELNGAFTVESGEQSSVAIKNRALILTSFTFGLIKLFAEEYDEAIAYFERTIELVDENDVEVNAEVFHFYIGRCLSAKASDEFKSYNFEAAKEYERQAIEKYALATKINPGYALAYVGMGHAYFSLATKDSRVAQPDKLDLLDKATRHYEQARDIAFKERTFREAYVPMKAYIGLGNACSAKKQWEEAIRYYQAALDLENESALDDRFVKSVYDRNRALAYYNIGTAYYFAQEFPKAVEAYWRCSRLAGSDQELKNMCTEWLEYVKSKM
jgi:tetratricopeptide (TPR) repeat protein